MAAAFRAAPGPGPARYTRSVASQLARPTTGSMWRRTTAAGSDAATASMSMPPRALTMARCFPAPRSSVNDTYHSAAISVARSTQTRFTRWPLMSMPRMAAGGRLRRPGVVGHLDAPRLAPAPDPHLGLHHHPAAQLLGAAARLGGSGGHPSLRHGDPHPGEQLLPLELEEIHAATPGCALRPSARCRPGTPPG